jgi:tetratricopeptide (TPR) repeat protein
VTATFSDGIGLIGHDNKEAERILLKCVDEYQDSPIDLHFTYNGLIKLYYKERDNWEGALGKCIDYCLEDIASFPEFKDAYINLTGNNTMPRIPSFEQLSIIYEKTGKYEEAISISQIALDNNLNDRTKGGFERRIDRLKKKKNKSKQE